MSRHSLCLHRLPSPLIVYVVVTITLLPPSPLISFSLSLPSRRFRPHLAPTTPLVLAPLICHRPFTSVYVVVTITSFARPPRDRLRHSALHHLHPHFTTHRCVTSVLTSPTRQHSPSTSLMSYVSTSRLIHFTVYVVNCRPTLSTSLPLCHSPPAIIDRLRHHVIAIHVTPSSSFAPSLTALPFRSRHVMPYLSSTPMLSRSSSASSSSAAAQGSSILIYAHSLMHFHF